MDLLRSTNVKAGARRTGSLLDVNQAWDDFEQTLFSMVGRVQEGVDMPSLLDPRAAIDSISATGQSSSVGNGQQKSWFLMQMYANEDRLKREAKEEEGAAGTSLKNAHRNWDWADQFNSPPGSPTDHSTRSTATAEAPKALRAGWVISPRTGRVAGLRRWRSSVISKETLGDSVPQRQLQSTSSLRPTSSDQQDREEGVDGLDELDELGSCDSVSTVKDREVLETKAALTHLKRTMSQYGDADARKGKSRWEQAMRQGHTPIKIKAKNTT